MQALWMVLASFFFATMAVCVKIASAWFSSAEQVFYRGVLGMLFMWMLARGKGVSLATRYAGMHAWRSLVGVLSLGAWFYAIGELPLATAMTLNYMSSVWIAAFLVGGALIAWNPRKGVSPPLRQGALVLTVLAGFEAFRARGWARAAFAAGAVGFAALGVKAFLAVRALYGLWGPFAPLPARPAASLRAGSVAPAPVAAASPRYARTTWGSSRICSGGPSAMIRP